MTGQQELDLIAELQMTTEKEWPYPFPKDGESTVQHWPELPDVESAGEGVGLPEPVAEFVGYHKVHFAELPTVMFFGKHPPLGTKLTDHAQATAEIAKRDARIEALEELASGFVDMRDRNLNLWSEIVSLRAQLAEAQKDAAALWMMLDDIDTGGDIAKADDVLYRAIAERSHKRRFEPRYEWIMAAIDQKGQS